jgi:hypothetical protein
MRVTDLSQIELTEKELRAIAGGQNHGQSTSEAVHSAQSFSGVTRKGNIRWGRKSATLLATAYCRLSKG